MTSEVTQEDAELVAFIIEEWGLMSGTTIGHIRRGLYNDDRIVKAAARHRIAALNARQPGEGEREALREALAEAYRKGATDVHNYWVNNPGEPPRGDPEFGESASDYAAAALDIFDSAAALRATDDAGTGAGEV